MEDDNAMELQGPLGFQRMIEPFNDQGSNFTYTGDSGLQFPAIELCPVEVLTEIFQYCLQDNTCQIERLLFVCKHWYRLIRYTPLFWTHITVSVLYPKTSEAAPHLRFVKAFIERSGDMLLDIEIDCGYVGSPYNVDLRDDWQNYAPAFDALCGTIHRCKTLHVKLPLSFSLSGAVCRVLKGPAPNLLELSVENFGYRKRQPVCFTDLLHLKVLDIDGYALKEMIGSLSSTTLSSLDIDLYGFDTWALYRGPSHWPALLSQLPSLRSLHIRYTADKHIPGATYNGSREGDLSYPIALPILKELGLWGLGTTELRFELPALETLGFDSTCLPKTNPIEVVWRPAPGIGPKSVVAQFLKAAILQYRSIKRFVVPSWARWALDEALQAIRGDPRVSIPSICFMQEMKQGKREPIELKEA